MLAVTCASQQPAVGRKATSTVVGVPAAPVVPLRPAAKRLQQLQANRAFSLFGAGEPEAQGSFSFVRPDLPTANGKADKKKATRGAPAAAKPEEVDDAARSAPKQRFRSALEQVSYMTNESAMNRMRD